MGRLLLYIIMCVAVLASCGRQEKAEGTVKGFLKENLAAEDYSVSLRGLDSTDRVTDSVLAGMRERAKSNPMYRKGLAFGKRKGGGKIMYIRGEVARGKDTVRQTFYLDSALESVIAVKED